MTAVEKKELACFLDLVNDAIRGGYGRTEHEYDFSDDAQPETAAAAHPPGWTDTLEAIANEVNACTACPLYKTRIKAVPGEGAAQPEVLVIGDGPDAEEDAAGKPFAGAAEERLRKMLAPIGLAPETNCFLTGVVKCRPPEKREPLPDETIACAAFLHRQIALLKPRIILCTGRIAAHSLMRTTSDIDKLRGMETKIRIGNTIIPVIVTYHPNEIWKNEELKRPAWEDLKRLKTLLDVRSTGSTEE